MLQYIGDDDVGRHFYAVRFRPDCLQSLPWGGEEFDCTVFACDPQQIRERAQSICAALVDANTDWVATTGPDAEWLHDLVDSSSVHRGRQTAVGDGSPMTAWHEDAVGVDQMADVVYYGAGGQDYVVALVVGNEIDFTSAVGSLKGRLARQRD